MTQLELHGTSLGSSEIAELHPTLAPMLCVLVLDPPGCCRSENVRQAAAPRARLRKNATLPIS